MCKRMLGRTFFCRATLIGFVLAVLQELVQGLHAFLCPVHQQGQLRLEREQHKGYP